MDISRITLTTMNKTFIRLSAIRSARLFFSCHACQRRSCSESREFSDGGIVWPSDLVYLGYPECFTPLFRVSSMAAIMWHAERIGNVGPARNCATLPKVAICVQQVSGDLGNSASCFLYAGCMPQPTFPFSIRGVSSRHDQSQRE